MRHLDLNLDRPTGIQDSSWKAINANVERLHRAIEAEDRYQAVGVAKELVESVAKSVLAVRGEAVSMTIKFSNLIDKAHAALERQPGAGLTRADPLRRLAQGAKSIVTQLAEIRNTYGSGHGRAEEPEVTEEVFELSLDAALLWVRWALRRLNALAQDVPDSLILHLLNYGIFMSSQFTEQLIATDLPQRDPAVQRRIGLVVGQRAMQEIRGVIRRGGIEACALSDDLKAWPPAYREGAFAGLFIAPYGNLTLDMWSAEWAARVIAPLPDPAAIIRSLMEKVRDLPLIDAPADQSDRAHLLDALYETSEYLPEQARECWDDLVEVFSRELSSEQVGNWGT